MDPTQPPSEAVHAQLTRMLESDTFRGAERARSLLRFVVEETLGGRADRLKDYTLGAEALGRGDSFDPRSDPIARVEASRLRSRLDSYYATEGATDPVHISLPKGGYVPAFAYSSRPVSPTSPPTDGPRRPRYGLVAATGLGVALAALLGGWFLGGTARSPDTPEWHVEVTTPPTTDPVSLALSPDGRALAFVASSDNATSLWLRDLTSQSVRPLPGTGDAAFPFWAPDGRSIGFFADGKVKRIDLDTGLISVMSAAAVPAGGTWNRDGVVLHSLVPDSPLFRTSTDARTIVPATSLAPEQTGHRGAQFLPDGRRFLFYAAGARDAKGVFLGELGTTAVRPVLDADGPAVFAPPDQLVYVRHGKLFAQRVEPRTMALVGTPVTLAGDVAIEAAAGMPALSASWSGTLAYRTGTAGGKRRFVWLDRTGRVVETVGAIEAAAPRYASISPNGRRLAIQQSRSGNTDVWLLDLERPSPSRFTIEPQADIAPVWSPRDDSIVYSSQESGNFELFRKPLQGGTAEPLLKTGVSKQVTDWSRDGRFLLFRTVRLMPTPDMDIWMLDLDNPSRPAPVVQTPFEERDAQFSPDGKWFAFQSNESGQPEIYLQRFANGGERVRVSTEGGVQVRWRADGRELFYLSIDGWMVSVPLIERPGAQAPLIGKEVRLFRARVGGIQGVALHHYSAAPDGQRFLVDTVVEEAGQPISMIFNWRGRP